MIVQQPPGPKNSDGAIYSPQVDVPAPRPHDWQREAYRLANEVALYRRLLIDQEKRFAWGVLSATPPFGSEVETS